MIRPNRLDAVVAMRRFRGVWAQLRVGMNDAVPAALRGAACGGRTEIAAAEQTRWSERPAAG